MSVIGHNVLLGASGNQGGYTVGNSLRFRSSASAYLSRTPAASSNRSTFTLSAWVKRGTLSGSASLYVFGAAQDINNAFYFGFANDALDCHQYTSGSNNLQVTSTAVYRDPAAWYHILASIDTTQATASNRAKIYINGVQITSLSTANYPAQNFGTSWNQNVGQLIGSGYNGSSPTGFLFDGYVAEVYNIDGQALTPSSFGAYDSNGVWQPKKYTGTYGTNGFYLPFSSTTTAGFSSYYGSFNGSNQYLSISTAAPIAFGTSSYTVEAWVYPTSFSKDTIIVGGTSTAVGQFGITTGGNLYIDLANTGTIGTSTSSLVLNRWQHIAYVRNGSTVTFYINGSNAGGSFTGSQSYAGATTNIGTTNNNTVNRVFTGYISNVRVNKTTAVYTANFTPPTSALTAIAGTSLLTLQNATIIDNSTNAYSITNTGSVAMTSATVGNYPTIANDSSGNGNNWTPNNISLTAGTTYDSMIDSPTVSATASNYCVLNQIDVGVTSNTPVTNGNLTTNNTNASGWASVRATFMMQSGKWYWECNGSANAIVGIMTLSASVSNGGNGYPGGDSFGYGYGSNNGSKYNNGSGSAYGATWTASTDICGIAFDADAGTLTFYKNGVSQGTAYTGLTSGLYFPAFGCAVSSSYSVNFGQRSFSYTPPTNYKALNTYNLPAATINNGAQYMAATLYTGTGTTLAVNNGANNTIGTTFAPNFVWIKSRSNAYNHELYDTVRGATLRIQSNLSNAESTSTLALTSFNSNGFTQGGQTETGGNGATYVAWQWQAGTASGSSNTSGSITSTVSANTTAGFSVVKYTGNGSAGATVGHSLGVAPSMIIVKNRTAANNWAVYHSGLTSAGYYLSLNQTIAQTANSGLWNNTAPTSSVFSVGTSGDTNGSTNALIAYCFSAVKGYSAFGSYTGNGSSNGPFIYTGFRPRWLLFKRTDTIGNWFIYDSSRGPYNANGAELYPNLTNAESATSQIDMLSNGFKMRFNSDPNVSGGAYIYAAFAENPFNISRAR